MQVDLKIDHLIFPFEAIFISVLYIKVRDLSVLAILSACSTVTLVESQPQNVFGHLAGELSF